MPKLRACLSNQSKSISRNLHFHSWSTPRVPQYEEEVSAAVDKEKKDKFEELKRQVKQIKGTDSLSNVNFIDVCILPELKFSSKFKCSDFKKYDGKSCPYAH